MASPQPQPVTTYAFKVDCPPCGGCGRCLRCCSAQAQTRAHGWLAKCGSAAREYLSKPSFWVGISLSFPIEHFLWEKVWPFDVLTKLLGL